MTVGEDEIYHQLGVVKAMERHFETMAEIESCSNPSNREVTLLAVPHTHIHMQTHTHTGHCIDNFTDYINWSLLKYGLVLKFKCFSKSLDDGKVLRLDY